MTYETKILLVEDSSSDIELLQNELTTAGIKCVLKIVQNERDYSNAIKNFIPDIILSDYSLSFFSGTDAFKIRKEIAADIPFIFVSGCIGEEKAVDFIKNGVTDYVLKDSLFTLGIKIKRALKDAKEQQEKSRTERELVLSEGLLARAQQLAHLGSWELNFTDNALTLSAEGCRIFGFQPHENKLSSATWGSLVHPDDLPQVLRAIEASKDTLQDTTYQHRIILKDGSIKNINSESKFEFDAAGKPIGLYGTMQDVTERVKTAQLLEFEKRNKEALINNTDDLIWSVSSGFKLVAANKAFLDVLEAITGTRLQPGDNLLVKEIFSPDYLSFWEGCYKKVLTGESLTEEIYSPAFNNSKESWSDICFNPIYNNDAVVGVACYSRNITEKKKAFFELKKSEKRYSDLFQLSPQPMFVFDPATYRFIQVNKAALRLYGYNKKEFLNMTLMDIEQEQGKPATAKENTGRFKRVNEILKKIVIHHKKSGEAIEVEIYMNTIIINDKSFRSVIAIDVTQKNHQEHKIIKAIIKTQDDERFEIGGELHDNVCQLLAASLLSLGMLKASVITSKMSLFNTGWQNISLALTEIRNLSHRLAPVFFDDVTMEEAFIRLFDTFNIEKKLEISLHFSESVKDYPVSIELQLTLYRILQEQLRNIQKYAKAHHVEVDVAIYDNKLEMKISDDGIGFNVMAVKGGIGLANMKRRAELFSGKFKIESSAGNGCAIVVDIPLLRKQHLNGIAV